MIFIIWPLLQKDSCTTKKISLDPIFNMIMTGSQGIKPLKPSTKITNHLLNTQSKLNLTMLYPILKNSVSNMDTVTKKKGWDIYK